MKLDQSSGLVFCCPLSASVQSRLTANPTDSLGSDSHAQCTWMADDNAGIDALVKWNSTLHRC